MLDLSSSIDIDKLTTTAGNEQISEERSRLHKQSVETGTSGDSNDVTDDVTYDVTLRHAASGISSESSKASAVHDDMASMLSTLPMTGDLQGSNGKGTVSRLQADKDNQREDQHILPTSSDQYPDSEYIELVYQLPAVYCRWGEIEQCSAFIVRNDYL